MAGRREGRRPLDLVVAGHANIDRILRVDGLPVSERTVPIREERAELGGSAATLARIAARAGVRTGLLTRVGPDFPPGFRAALHREGVNLTGVEVVPGTRSPSCYIVEDAHGHQFTLIHQGPMGSARDARIPVRLLRSTCWLHLTTGDPDFQLRLKEAARHAGVRIAVDPAQEIHYRWRAPRLSRLLEGAEILFGNDGEVRRIMHMLSVDRVSKLLDLVPLVVVTHGARGVSAHARTGVVRVPAARLRRLRQVTGAGDAFRGGFYGAFFGGRALKPSLEAGTRAAAAWMQRSPESDSSPAPVRRTEGPPR
jgi:sugar/nucleoside kinase (ribokinase family)